MQLVALKFTVVKPVQPENAEFPIEVTELGIVTSVKPVQSENASLIIVVTLSPILSVFKFLQLRNIALLELLKPIEEQFVALKFIVVKLGNS